MRRVGGAERERRGRGGCDRHERRDRRRDAREDPRRERARSRARTRGRCRSAYEQDDEVVDAVVRPLDPGDQAEGQGDRHRVVAAGLRLERAREPTTKPRARAASRTPPRHRSRRPPSRGGTPRATTGRTEMREAAGERGGDGDSDGREERRRDRDRTQPPPRGRQAALVEDRDQRHDADLARDGGVVERDAAWPVRAEDHPEAEKRHERRQGRLRGAEGQRHARREHRADGEHGQSDCHVGIVHECAVHRRALVVVVAVRSCLGCSVVRRGRTHAAVVPTARRARRRGRLREPRGELDRRRRPELAVRAIRGPVRRPRQLHRGRPSRAFRTTWRSCRARRRE